MKKGKIIGYIIINFTTKYPESRNEEGISMGDNFAELFPTRKAANRLIKQTLKYSDDNNCGWENMEIRVYPVREAAK